MFSTRFAHLVALVAVLAATPALASAPTGAGPDAVAIDPLVPMIHRVDRYVQDHEVDGVVLDWRVVVNASEAARLSVVPQLLAYEELERVWPSPRMRVDIVDRSEYMIEHFEEFRGHGVFDGMLALAFYQAYEAIGDPRYLAHAEIIDDELKGMPGQLILNGGLMAAMGFAKDAQLTHDTVAEQLAHQAIGSIQGYQHADGSFPHWCAGSTDVHYTDWMATELILIQRTLTDTRIDPMLQRMLGFMEQRVDKRGVTQYEAPCDAYPGCVTQYYSIATGCGIDYDTRAFTNEIGYSALLFAHFRSPKYRAVMRFLGELETGGTWKDKWDFWPPPTDPYWVWTAADTSVVNTSLLFWSLATVLTDRALPVRPTADPFPDGGPGIARAPASAADRLRLSIAPNPTRAGCALRLVLPTEATISLAIYDASGRRVRTLDGGRQGPGEHMIAWDRRDEAGHACASGVYLVRVRAGEHAASARLLLVR